MHVRLHEAEGLQVPVEVWGAATDTLVFLPGLGCRPSYYRAGLEALAERFRVFVPDLSFRTHHSLPATVAAYLRLVTAVAGRVAPTATWCGHSFGALLALLGDRPAIACAPSVPAGVALPRMFGRAVRLQVREWVGLEGAYGMRYAPKIMVDYVRTAATRPRALFAPVADLRRPATAFPIRSPNAVLFVCARDELYRPHEQSGYIASAPGPGIRVCELDDGHDWPITRPARLATRVEQAFDRLATSTAAEAAVEPPAPVSGREARTRSSPG